MEDDQDGRRPKWKNERILINTETGLTYLCFAGFLDWKNVLISCIPCELHGAVGLLVGGGQSVGAEVNQILSGLNQHFDFDRS